MVARALILSLLNRQHWRRDASRPDDAVHAGASLHQAGRSFLQTAANGQPPFSGLFKWVFGAGWDWNAFDVNRDMPIVDATLGGDVNDATRGSLRAFKAVGGKLIIYHGLADSLVPPAQSVAFYERQARDLGGMTRLQSAARLFLVPGVMHCGGGSGPDSFNSALGGVLPPPVKGPGNDLFSALIRWTQGDGAPDRVVATKFLAGRPGKIEFQRPVCAYPQIARHKGIGSTTVADNFICSAKLDSPGQSVGNPKAREAQPLSRSL